MSKQEETVWVSSPRPDSKTTYHTKKHCSGLDQPNVTPNPVPADEIADEWSLCDLCDGYRTGSTKKKQCPYCGREVYLAKHLGNCEHAPETTDTL